MPKRSWVDQRIKEYEEGKRDIQIYWSQLKRSANKGYSANRAIEISIVGGMISEMAMAIEWMQTGRQPGTYRGIDRRGVYREPFVLDKDLFPSLQEPESKPKRLTNEERDHVIQIIRSLTDPERNCFMLYVVDGVSQRKIADSLGLDRRTVRTNIARAYKKIENARSQLGQAI
ncbi:sigma-70 family RNA polymerase sigma factor [Paenibacillaceae bacterium WGS1546]|uniref:sigma-70 family RNA polymerase sigma factor n=1 Tax=Cohnella sp. WGS1546 TaxID=3366810 RepID=UPI00372D4282